MSKVTSSSEGGRIGSRSRVGRANTMRLMELAYALMTARQPLTRHQLVTLVEGYRDAGDENTLARMFERDKAALREVGMEVQTAETSAGVEGYWVRDRDFVLPEVDFNASEQAMLALAGRVWHDHARAGESRQALAKLAASGVELDEAPARAFQPSLSTREEAFWPLWEATVKRRRVRFDYRTSEGAVSSRDLEPWVLGQRGGAWYVSGYDRDRLDQRSFKLSRITSMPSPHGPEQAYAIPEGIEPAKLLASLAPGSGDQLAVIAVRGEYAPALRRRATEARHDQTPEGYTAHQVTYVRSADLISELAVHGADVLVLDPPSVRQDMIEHLQRVVATHHDAPVDGGGDGDEGR